LIWLEVVGLVWQLVFENIVRHNYKEIEYFSERAEVENFFVKQVIFQEVV